MAWSILGLFGLAPKPLPPAPALSAFALDVQKFKSALAQAEAAFGWRRDWWHRSLN